MENADPKPVHVVIRRRQIIHIQEEVRRAAPVSISIGHPFPGRSSRLNGAHVNPIKAAQQKHKEESFNP